MTIKAAVFNQKGGVGKTTLSIILTQIALMKGKKVLAIDQDEQCNFYSSISYLEHVSKFKDLLTLKTVLTEKDFDTQTDLMIIDCPPTFNPRSNLAVKKADFVLIPVRPDYYSIMHFSRIYKIAGDYKLPLVKVWFTGNVASKEADRIIRGRNYVVMGELPLYANISNNLSSDKHKWWSVGLKKSERQPFEFIYNRLELFHERLQELRKTKPKPTPTPDYYEDPENPDIAIFGRH